MGARNRRQHLRALRIDAPADQIIARLYPGGEPTGCRHRHLFCVVDVLRAHLAAVAGRGALRELRDVDLESLAGASVRCVHGLLRRRTRSDRPDGRAADVCFQILTTRRRVNAMSRGTIAVASLALALLSVRAL